MKRTIRSEQTLTCNPLIVQVWVECKPVFQKRRFTKRFVEATVLKKDSITRGTRLDLSIGAFLGQRSQRTTFSVEKVVVLGIILAADSSEQGAPFTAKTTFEHQLREMINWRFDSWSSTKWYPLVGGFLCLVPRSGTAGRILLETTKNYTTRSKIECGIGNALVPRLQMST